MLCTFVKMIVMKRAALFGMSAVILGAFGAHALKKIIEPDMLAIFHTGVQYQFYHALALLGVAILRSQYQDVNLDRAARFFTFGILLFSGSLYILALKQLLAFLPLSVIGPVTPVGGVFFITGWFYLFQFSRKAEFNKR